MNLGQVLRFHLQVCMRRCFGQNRDEIVSLNSFSVLIDSVCKCDSALDLSQQCILCTINPTHENNYKAELPLEIWIFLSML